MRLALVCLVAVAMIVPSGSAHIAHPPSSKVLELGDFQVAVTPVPAPVYANASTSFIVIDVAADPSRPLPLPRIRFSDTSGFLFEKPFTRNDTYYETERFSFDRTGEIQGRVIIDDGGTEQSAKFTFHVFRPLPFLFSPIDALSDPTAGQAYRLTFLTLDKETSIPFDAVSDLYAFVVPRDSTPDPSMAALSFAANGTGTWTTNHTFPKSGPWLILLSSTSGGFEPHETAPWQVDVLTAPAEESPSLSLVTVLALVAVSTMLVAPRMRARGRRPR